MYTRVSELYEFVHRMDILSMDTDTEVSYFRQPSFESLLKLLLRGTLHSQLPIDFEGPIRAFYLRALQVFHARNRLEKPHAGWNPFGHLTCRSSVDFLK